VAPHLPSCSMNLYEWSSGYNGKTILRSQRDEERFEWDMDSSDTDVMHASGTFFIPVNEAWMHLSTLVNVFKKAGLPYEVGIDDEYGELAYSTKL